MVLVAISSNPLTRWADYLLKRTALRGLLKLNLVKWY
nr:MAG TPA: hypothetical protein [Caudoviricetes sp.]